MELLIQLFLALITTLSPAAEPATAIRISIPSMDIALGVVAGDAHYPLCDVAQYMPDLSDPGQPGTTYIYGHARDGMFGPLLTESLRHNGERMVGRHVHVWTSDGLVHTYRITRVKRHAVDLSIVKGSREQLVLQTSEGPHGTVPKLQVLAVPTSVKQARDVSYRIRPRDCSP